MIAEAFAPGKLILAGEHAVVHGQPALAFAVDRGTTARLTPSDRQQVSVDDPKVRDAVRTLLGDAPLQVDLTTTLPIGRGMGSSASLSVALVRARNLLEGRDDATPEQVLQDALPLERIFHDNPSGVDVAVSARGGVLRFLKGPPATMTSLPAPSWQVVVLDTGKVGVTATLVAGVTSRRPGIDPQLERIGALVDEAAAVLDDPEALGLLLDENHALLRAIGVSTAGLDALCDLARRHGAHGAKLSGAGGGGVVLALVDDPTPLLSAAREAGIEAWACRPKGTP